jgi:tetratricopeptide (TPR) repeat protein
MVIGAQRNRLNDLRIQIDHIIRKSSVDKQSDANKLVELRKALDVWEGRGSPWQSWTAQSDEGPRKLFLQKLANQGDQLAAPWQSSTSHEQRAYGHLALAIMNDEMNRPAEAVSHYEEALDLLKQLSADSPATSHYAAAIADCYRQLGRLRANGDRDRAVSDLEQSRAISQSLASQHPDARLQAELAEAVLDSSITSGGAGGAQNLVQLQQIESDFFRLVPQDPIALYELTSFLAGREPILITRKPSTDAE